MGLVGGGVSPPPSTFGPGTVLFEDDDIDDDDEDLEVGAPDNDGAINGAGGLAGTALPPPPSGLLLRYAVH